ncbi:MAG: CPBP family intramembrane glutamic endopeptidase [Candidatus Korobacteraceae bacterium]
MSTSGDPLPPQPAPPRPWPLAPEPEPLFGLGEVFFVFLAALVAVIVCSAFALAIAHHLPSLRHARTADLADNPLVLLPAQLVAYLLIFALLWRLFTRYFRIGFFRALLWRWPPRWLRFLAAGALLGLAIQFVSNWLPSPPELPIDEMLRTPSDAWSMTVFGVLIAPFAEEVLFRGLLFPALARHTGALLSLLLTALFFGAVHSAQLAGAWSQIACIALVGLVLTAVRWRFHSLASSTLVHVGYNGVLFAMLFFQTHGFTQLPAK